MKDFEYYSKIKVPYPDRSGYRRDLISEIDAKPLTKLQREGALADVSSRADEWFAEVIKPYREEQERLEAEFWADCRSDIGYDKFLNADGVAAVEAFAYEHGHAAGFGDIHSWAYEASELARKIVHSIQEAQ